MTKGKEIYLDNAATTPVYKEAVKEMNKFLSENYGNPSSVHALGHEAMKAMNSAREKFAREIGAKIHEIIFTSCATESNNIALRALTATKSQKKNKIIISAIEHPSIEEVVKYLETEKEYEIIRIPVDGKGIIDLKDLKKEIDEKTLLVSVMHVNNIIGSIQPLKEIGKICKSNKVLFHTDAVQSFGKLDINVRNMNVDSLSASAHKIGGPKGIGLLYVREGVKLTPWLFGGGQEGGLRSGTENVAGIVGFAKALDVVRKVNKRELRRVRDMMSSGLQEIGGTINSPEEGIYNLINVSFPANAERLVHFLSKKGIYVSTGSACESKRQKEDRVLDSIGMSKEQINGAIRISINEDVTEKDIEIICKFIKEGVKKVNI